MKKIIPAVFAVFCVAVCLVPSLGMVVRPTVEPIGNERSSKPPEVIKKDGSVNFGYLTELGGYYEKHFAFRPEMITADATIQANLFGNSSIDTVIAGTDGWLYYTSDANDFLGRSPLTEAQINGVVHNLGIIQRYAQSKGARFLFTVAPNKSTLYPGHMPYYYVAKASDVHNRDLLRQALADSDIAYCDLFAPLGERSKTLYFKRDSHWDNTGALLAYNEVTDSLGKEHNDYSGAVVTRRRDFTGDLSKMLYPASEEAEYNTYYGAETYYSYITDTKSVEDTLIKTEAPDARGTLYMYRDSFGNALVPFFASAYHNATFTKAFPMNVAADLDACKPDTFVMELVERNINWLITMPPLLPASELSYYKSAGTIDGKATFKVKPCDYAAEYTEITGTAEGVELDSKAEYYVSVNNRVYEAYSLTRDGADGFLVYLPADAYPAEAALDIKLIVKSNGEFYEITGGSNEN